MLPVRVKVLSSSSCSLSQASSLIQRFLSGDACSDSLARDYAANVAQALQDSISRRAGASGTPLDTHRHFPSSSLHLSGKELVDGTQSISATKLPTSSSAQAKLPGLENQRSQAGKWKPSSIVTVDDVGAAGSTIEEAETAHRRHKKKRRHSAIENGTEMVFPVVQDADDIVVVHHDKKRRKKEKAKRETEHISIEKSTPANQKSGKKEKSERRIEPFETDFVTPDNQNRRKKEKADRGGDHMATEIVIPDKERHREKKKRKDREEAENNRVELASPSTNDQKSDEKMKRKKEKQGKDAENAQVIDIESLLTESLVTESSVKKRKKRDVGSLEANGITEVGNSVLPVSPGVNQKEGSLKRKKKEKEGVSVTPAKDTSKHITGKTDVEAMPVNFDNQKEGSLKRKKKEKEGVSVTPTKDTSKHITGKTNVEAMPVNFDNVDSQEKKRKRKKRTRNLEPEFD